MNDQHENRYETAAPITVITKRRAARDRDRARSPAQVHAQACTPRGGFHGQAVVRVLPQATQQSAEHGELLPGSRLVDGHALRGRDHHHVPAAGVDARQAILDHPAEELPAEHLSGHLELDELLRELLGRRPAGPVQAARAHTHPAAPLALEQSGAPVRSVFGSATMGVAGSRA